MKLVRLSGGRKTRLYAQTVRQKNKEIDTDARTQAHRQRDIHVHTEWIY
jgi:hypothetical protein